MLDSISYMNPRSPDRLGMKFFWFWIVVVLPLWGLAYFVDAAKHFLLFVMPFADPVRIEVASFHYHEIFLVFDLALKLLALMLPVDAISYAAVALDFPGLYFISVAMLDLFVFSFLVALVRLLHSKSRKGWVLNWFAIFANYVIALIFGLVTQGMSQEPLRDVVLLFFVLASALYWYRRKAVFVL